MPEFLWETIEEWIKRPKEVGMPKYPLEHHHIPQAHSEDIPPAKAIENVLVTGYQCH